MHLRLLQSSSSSLTMTNPYNDIAVSTAIENAIASSNSNPLLLMNGIVSSLSSSPILIGTAWMISSAIFTTYSTTKFIKYKKLESSDRKLPTARASTIIQHPFHIQQYIAKTIRNVPRLRVQNFNFHKNTSKKTMPTTQSRESTTNLLSIMPPQQYDMVPKRSNGFSVLSPSSVLTMYRFAGSLFFGLMLHTDIWSLQQRLYDTIASIPSLLIPSICLFIANFSNT
jgi:hypothetical protein